MFWIFYQNSVDNKDVLVIAEQWLHSIKAFYFSHAAPPVSQLGVHKKLGGDTAGTADPNRPKGYSRPYDVTISNKTWGKEAGRAEVNYGVCLAK